MTTATKPTHLDLFARSGLACAAVLAGFFFLAPARAEEPAGEPKSYLSQIRDAKWNVDYKPDLKVKPTGYPTSLQDYKDKGFSELDLQLDSKLLSAGKSVGGSRTDKTGSEDVEARLDLDLGKFELDPIVFRGKLTTGEGRHDWSFNTNSDLKASGSLRDGFRDLRAHSDFRLQFDDYAKTWDAQGTLDINGKEIPVRTHAEFGHTSAWLAGNADARLDRPNGDFGGSGSATLRAGASAQLFHADAKAELYKSKRVDVGLEGYVDVGKISTEAFATAGFDTHAGTAGVGGGVRADAELFKAGVALPIDTRWDYVDAKVRPFAEVYGGRTHGNEVGIKFTWHFGGGTDVSVYGGGAMSDNVGYRVGVTHKITSGEKTRELQKKAQNEAKRLGKSAWQNIVGKPEAQESKPVAAGGNAR